MRKKIIIVAIAAGVSVVLSIILPWTITSWTPIHMSGIPHSAGFVGRTSIMWSTVIVVGGVSGAFLFLPWIFWIKKPKIF